MNSLEGSYLLYKLFYVIASDSGSEMNEELF
jgi:hypothetical protein